MVLFLNFDGVLHPNAVRFGINCKPILKAPRHRLFESNNALAAVIGDFTNLRLVLNTWWTYVVGLDECLHRLPKSLSSRVDGSILRHADSYQNFPHRIELATDAAEKSAEPIVILDHEDARYPAHLLRVALLLDPQVGLADPRAIQALYCVVSRTTERELKRIKE